MIGRKFQHCKLENTKNMVISPWILFGEVLINYMVQKKSSNWKVRRCIIQWI